MISIATWKSLRSLTNRFDNNENTFQKSSLLKLREVLASHICSLLKKVSHYKLYLVDKQT